MNPQAAQHYLRTKVMTATPEQLQLMLYDGAIRFGEQARIALSEKNFEQSYNGISKMQRIITEMTSSLKHEMQPELCSRLAALYNYVYRLLIEANIDHKLESLEEGLNILRYQRETWVMLLGELSRQKAGSAANKLDMPAPDERMESICVKG